MPFEFSRSRAPRTTELYQTVWKDWQRFASDIGASAMPAKAEDVLEFLRAREPTHSSSALSARRAAIIAAHKDARSRLPKAKRAPYMLDHDDALALGWKEISRRKGNRHTPREAIDAAKLKVFLAQVPNTAVGIMDRAALLVGFSIAMRRSEIAALNRDDIEFDGEDTMLVHIRRSKTDQQGNGITLAAGRGSTPETCPIAAMKHWLECSGITEGALFQHPKFKVGRRIDDAYVYWAIKRYAKSALLDPRPFGGHSLRRGAITTIHEAGVDRQTGMQLSRHSTPGIYDSYIAHKDAAASRAVHAIAAAL
jgi:integrase